MPVAVTPVNSPSADAPTHTAPGNSATNGSVVRARFSLPSKEIVTGTATAARQPTSTQTIAATPPPPSPMRSSQTKISVAPGG